MDNEYRVAFRGIDSLLCVIAYASTSEGAVSRATRLLVVMVKDVKDWAYESCDLVPEATDLD